MMTNKPMALIPAQHLGLYSWQREAALERLSYFRDQMLNRVFPAFETIEEEAQSHGNAIFNAAVSAPSWVEGDEGSAAEAAHEAAVIHYGELERVLQTSINFAAASLFHVHWETPARDWLTREAPMFGASKTQMKKLETTKLEDVSAFLKGQGWEFSAEPWFATLDELRLVANTVKHARGDSARALFERRRTLFFPFNRMGEDEMIGSYEPDGDDLVVTPEDFRQYASALECFWQSAPAGDEG